MVLSLLIPFFAATIKRSTNAICPAVTASSIPITLSSSRCLMSLALSSFFNDSNSDILIPSFCIVSHLP